MSEYILTYPKNWEYYLSVCKKLGIKNVISKRQFDFCVDNNSVPYLLILREYGYNFKQVKNEKSIS